MFATIIIFLIVIVVLVVAHEFGHFFVAKIFGVRVDEFGLGYPPRAKKMFEWKGTLFTLNWLPFGGFVKIFGEDDNILQSKDSFAFQKLYKRLLILVAGIIANLLLAMVLYAITFSVGFNGNPSDFPNAKIISSAKITIVDVLPNTPAKNSGLEINDQIVSVDNFNIIDINAFVSYIQSHQDKNIIIHIIRNSKEQDISISPKYNPSIKKASIGIALDQVALLKESLLSALWDGFIYTINEFIFIFVTLGSLVSGLFYHNDTLVKSISGPVGIAKLAREAYDFGFVNLLSFMATISVNLAVINLLPFPALDGGRMIIELFSRNGKSKISPNLVMWINQIGFILLILLMLFVTYRDIFFPHF